MKFQQIQIYIILTDSKNIPKDLDLQEEGLLVEDILKDKILPENYLAIKVIIKVFNRNFYNKFSLWINIELLIEYQKHTNRKTILSF